MKKLLVILMLLTASLMAWSQKSPVFVTDNGAIHGYDPVAFFKEHKPVPGSKDISYEWNGGTWHFVSDENKAAFIKDPVRYAPQYGGYCAFGTAEGHKAPTQIETWSIVNDRLYFNYNKQVQKEWNENQAELIRKTDENWPTVKDSQ
ncbi:MAG: YHS domain-containing (seleno)protein [Chryseolinea sp.]